MRRRSSVLRQRDGNAHSTGPPKQRRCERQRPEPERAAHAPTKLVLCSGAPRAEAEALAGAAHALGVKIVEAPSGIVDDASHVLVHGPPSGPLPLAAYFGAALGACVVDASWVFCSLEAGKWLAEDTFERAECRAARLARGPSGVLAGERVCFWGGTHLPLASLEALVRAAGGATTRTARASTTIVADDTSRPLPHAVAGERARASPDAPRLVGAKWLFDAICPALPAQLAPPASAPTRAEGTADGAGPSTSTGPADDAGGDVSSAADGASDESSVVYSVDNEESDEGGDGDGAISDEY